MSDIEDSHPDDRTATEVEEVTNEQYERLRPDEQMNSCTQLTKRLKLHDPCQVVLLNEDILHHLFSFFNIQELVKMSRVCKVWQMVSRQKIKFASTASFAIEIGFGNPRSMTRMNISIMKNVLEQTDKSVRQVYIDGFCRKSSKKIICLEIGKILSDNCPNLTYLYLHHVEMSHIFCNNLGKCLPPNLKTLEIILFNELEDQNFNNILGNCTNLENLVIQFASGLRGISIIENLKNGQLKKLSLVDCDDIEEHFLFRIMKMFKSSLRELELHHEFMADGYALGMHSHILADVKFDLLETLTLRGCNNLQLFLSAMPNLKTLNLLEYYNYQLSATNLVSAIIKCQKLKSFRFYDDMPTFNDDHVFTMISSMPSLRLLGVNMECEITGSFVTKCADLDRTEPIKVKLSDGVKIDSFPDIPSFLELWNATLRTSNTYNRLL